MKVLKVSDKSAGSKYITKVHGQVKAKRWIRVSNGSQQECIRVNMKQSSKSRPEKSALYFVSYLQLVSGVEVL